MDYKTYKIYDCEDLSDFTESIKIAQCMKLDTYNYSSREEASREALARLEELTVSEKLLCSFCNTSFDGQQQQRQHYKLDWHRYNLKQHLGGLRPVSEDNFAQVADDVSSISGSESDTGSEDETNDSSTNAPQSASRDKTAKFKHRRINRNGSSSESEDEKTVLGRESRDRRLQASRHVKVFFENADGKIFSLYRCLLHGKKEVQEEDEVLVSLAQQAVGKSTWAILMLGGGHFAAAIFHGSEVVVHKTFHSYTVRARQGGGQSSRDSRSGGSHPKSAGASLRRYNEASLLQHVQNMMDSWSAHLSQCSLIIYRAVGHNRGILFGGRNPPLKKDDPRLRSVPFPTRRATFSEVKRVHDILSTLEVYGSAIDFCKVFPQSPNKKITKLESVSNGAALVGDAAPELLNGAVSSLSLMEIAKKESASKEVGVTSPKSKVIDRAKARKSPHRPLPDIVAELARTSSESEEGQGVPREDGSVMTHADVEMSFGESLKEFDDDVPREERDRKNRGSKKSGRKKKKISAKIENKEEVRDVLVNLKKKLWTICNLGDLALLESTLSSVQPEPSTEQGSSTAPDVAPSNDTGGIVTGEELLKCLNEGLDQERNTPLHLATLHAHQEVVRKLLEAGCDPGNKNKKKQPPYVLAPNKETRHVYRRFMGEFPDKYDYSKSQIPSPLSDDIEQVKAEKRRELRKVKKEKDKIRKQEDDKRRAEEDEKERFLRLSDREKRAVAAELRLMAQATRHGGPKPVISRCFLCASDISGQVPFEYDGNRFCTMTCLKAHRMKSKTQLK